MIRKNDLSEVLFAFVIIAFGLFLVYSGIDLSIGKMSRIGPGFLPLCLGVIITALGIGILFERQEKHLDIPPNIRGLALITLAIGAFAALVETTGLFPATAALVILTALANRVVERSGGLGRPVTAKKAVPKNIGNAKVFLCFLCFPLFFAITIE